jgi:hypothetical protein
LVSNRLLKVTFFDARTSKTEHERLFLRSDGTFDNSFPLGFCTMRKLNWMTSKLNAGKSLTLTLGKKPKP